MVKVLNGGGEHGLGLLGLVERDEVGVLGVGCVALVAECMSRSATSGHTTTSPFSTSSNSTTSPTPSGGLGVEIVEDAGSRCWQERTVDILAYRPV